MADTTVAPTGAVTPVTQPPEGPLGVPKALEQARRLDDQIRVIRNAGKNVSWQETENALHELRGTLEASGAALTDEQRQEIGDILREAKFQAEQANKWSVLEILSCFLGIGLLAGLFDLLTTNDHERVQDVLDKMSKKPEVGYEPENTQFVIEALAPGTSGGGDTGPAKQVIARKGKEIAAMKPADLQRFSQPQLAAIARRVADDANDDQQVAFIRSLMTMERSLRLDVARPTNDASDRPLDPSRLMPLFDAGVIAKAMRPQEFASLDDQAKLFVSALVARQGSHKDMRVFSQTLKQELDTESRVRLVRGLLAGWTDGDDESAILKLLFPTEADTAVAEKVLANGRLFEQLKSDIDGDNFSAFKLQIYEVYKNTRNRDLRDAIIESGLPTHP